MTAAQSNAGRSEHLWILALCALALAGSFALRPAGDGSLQFTAPWVGWTIALHDMCMSRRILGISCPGCGLTRSFAAMSRGDFSEAFRMNFMGPALYVLCWAQIPYRIGHYLVVGLSPQTWDRVGDLGEYLVWAVAAGLILSWLVRLAFF